MTILLTGATGQVGHELLRSLRPFGELVAPTRAQLDLADSAQLRATVRALKPSLIVHPAAWTDVDGAERDPALAMRINADAPAVLAEEAKRLGVPLVHFSTDHVFDGAASQPYTERDTPAPVNAYGCSKLAGEQAIAASGCAHLILRTAWVYGLRGRNFLLAILRQAQTNDVLRVVDDQFGSPTWCRTVADVTAELLARARAAPDANAWWAEHGGVLHASARGGASRAAFARRILANAGLAERVTVIGVDSASYAAPAARPRYAVLDTARLQRLVAVPAWDDALRQCQAVSPD